jgi:phosphoserine aminotransferase
MLQYRTYTEFNSLYNTPPTYAIYVLERYLAWIERSGGVEAMHHRAKGRASAVYQALDAHPLYQMYADIPARSLMNVTFGIEDPAIKSAFLKEALHRGLHGLAGHKVLGGMRISLYNGCTDASVHELVSYLEDFGRKWG